MRRRLFAILLAVTLLGTLSITVFAQSVPDLTKNGSITFKITYNNEGINGGTMTIYRVGDIVEDDGNYSFRLIEKVDANKSIVDNPQKDGLAKDLSAKVQRKDAYLDANVVKGEVKFTNVEPGLYLVMQHSAASGFESISPFLISVPQYESGKYTLDVVAKPKVPIETEPKETQPTTPSKPSDDKLPDTGQLNWPVPVLVCSGVVALILGCMLRFGRKKEFYEK